MTTQEPSEQPESMLLQQVAAVLGIIAIVIALMTDPDFEKLATLIGTVAALAALVAIPNKLQRRFSIALAVGVVIAAVFVAVRTFSVSSAERETPTPTVVASAQFPQIATPESGAIKQSSPNGIALACADVNVKNFIVESRFFNPFDSALHPWSYGFFFRYTPGDEYRLSVNHEGRVGFGIVEESQGKVVSEKFPEGVNTSPDGSNHIRLTVQGKDAVVYINDRYIATFDVAERQAAGNICLAAGFFPGDNIPGQETVYRDFTIYALPE